MTKKFLLVVAVLILVALLLSGLPPQLVEASPAAETEWVHHKWEQSGRTLYNPDTGQYKYVSYIGQTNIDLGDGNYAPYVWNPVTKVAKFADCQLRFFNPHFEFWRNGSKLTNAKLQLLKKVGSDWVNIPVFFHGLTVNEGDEFATAILKLKDENNNEIIANIRFGLFHYIVLDFEVKVNAEGEYRLEMENTGLSGDPGEIHSGKGIDGKAEDRVIGVVYEKMYFRWSYEEAPDRLYLHEVQPDGSETSRKIVELGHLSLGETKLLSPDQWGPTAIAVNADDGEEDGRLLLGPHRWQVDGWYSDGALFLGYHSGFQPTPFEPAWRWDNITASGIAQDGCKIEIWHNDDHTEGGPDSVDSPLYGIDEADPAQFSDVAGNRPSDRTKTTAYVTWASVREAPDQSTPTHEKATSPEIKTIIQELLDSYTYTGNEAMAFTWFVTYTAEGWWRNYDDFSMVGGTPARLTIVYNQPPNTPSNLGPASYVDGSWGNDNTPTLTFTQSDPDVGDTVKYTIQIDDSSDFSSPVVDYTSGLLTQGGTSFTVGQAAGAGSYAIGFEGQTLADGSYYWRVMSTDNNEATSGWSTANGGAIAFQVDTIPQTGGSSNSAGAAKDKFSIVENVYATGSGFFPSSNVDIYVVEDREWSNGDPIPADVGDGMDTIPTDDTGNLGPVVIWSATLEVGGYDLVFDANQDGFYDVIIDLVDDQNEPGFVVVPLPTADFSGEPTAGVAPLTVQFTNESTGDSDSWSWDFGDDDTSDEQNPSHTYTASGIYTVSLTISRLGRTDTETKEDYITVYEGVVADFSAEPTEGVAPLEVQFTNESTGDINSWSWDFGDSSTSTEQNPSHRYSRPGRYTVSLEVNGPGGTSSEVKEYYIQVYKAPTATKKTSGPANLLVGPANLSVCNLLVTPNEVYPNDWVTIDFDVKNSGGRRGSKVVEVLINGYGEYSERISVHPRSSKHLRYFVYKTIPGQYIVTVEEATGWFNVLQPSQPSYVLEYEDGDLGMGDIIAMVVIGIMVIGGIIVAIMLTRRV